MNRAQAQRPTAPSIDQLLPAAAMALARELGRTPSDLDLRVVNGTGRTWSHTWELRAQTGDYFLKWLPLRAHREAELARMCRELFANEPMIRTPRVACSPTSETFLVEKLAGASLQSSCTAPPLIGLSAWMETQSVLLGRVGLWLRRFHGASQAGISGPLQGVKAYVGNREAAFEAIGPELAAEFKRTLDGSITRGAVRIHGDFTPHNVLVTDGTVAVIDFAGITECETETRCLDAAAMIVGLEEAWRRRARNHLRFFPSPMRQMIAAFLRSSGVEEDVDPLPICYAVRHLTRAYNTLRKTGKVPGQRNWHVQRIRAALERPELIRQLAGGEGN